MALNRVRRTNGLTVGLCKMEGPHSYVTLKSRSFEERSVGSRHIFVWERSLPVGGSDFLGYPAFSQTTEESRALLPQPSSGGGSLVMLSAMSTSVLDAPVVGTVAHLCAQLGMGHHST